MRSEPLPQRVLVTHAAPAAFAPTTLGMLARLGYAVVDPDLFARLQSCTLDGRHLGLRRPGKAEHHEDQPG